MADSDSLRHNNDGSSYPIEYGDQDLGRMRTQREFITEVIKQVVKAENFTKIDDYIKIANNNVGDIHVARQFMSINSFINKEFLIIYLHTLVAELSSEAKSMIPGIDRNQVLSKT